MEKNIVEIERKAIKALMDAHQEQQHCTCEPGMQEAGYACNDCARTAWLFRSILLAYAEDAAE